MIFCYFWPLSWLSAWSQDLSSRLGSWNKSPPRQARPPTGPMTDHTADYMVNSINTDFFFPWEKNRDSQKTCIILWRKDLGCKVFKFPMGVGRNSSSHLRPEWRWRARQGLSVGYPGLSPRCLHPSTRTFNVPLAFFMWLNRSPWSNFYTC